MYRSVWDRASCTSDSRTGTRRSRARTTASSSRHALPRARPPLPSVARSALGGRRRRARALAAPPRPWLPGRLRLRDRHGGPGRAARPGRQGRPREARGTVTAAAASPLTPVPGSSWGAVPLRASMGHIVSSPRLPRRLAPLAPCGGAARPPAPAAGHRGQDAQRGQHAERVWLEWARGHVDHLPRYRPPSRRSCRSCRRAGRARDGARRRGGGRAAVVGAVLEPPEPGAVALPFFTTQFSGSPTCWHGDGNLRRVEQDVACRW